MRRVLVLSILLATTTPAFAGEPDSAVSYGVLAGELSLLGVMAGQFSGVLPNEGPGFALSFAPILIIPGAALGAHYGGLDPSPALAVHGGLWYGASGMLLGSLIDGRTRGAWRLRAGVATWTLGAAGAIAGGVIGALKVDGEDEGSLWMAAPPVGFVAGGLVLGSLLVLIGGIDGDDAPGQWATGALVGLAAGLGVATYFSIRGTGDTAPSRLQPSVAGSALSSDRATIFSFGGAF